MLYMVIACNFADFFTLFTIKILFPKNVDGNFVGNVCYASYPLPPKKVRTLSQQCYCSLFE